jgi:hypothetical protein
MITANELMKIEMNRQAAIEKRKMKHEQSVEAVKAARLERAKVNYEHAKENVVKLCEDRIGTLIEETIERQGLENFSVRLPVSLFTDELGNKLFKVATKDEFVPEQTRKRSRFRNDNREYLVIGSSDFCYKTFQQYLKKHGFRVVQERSKETIPSRWSLNSSIVCNIVTITLLNSPAKDEG